MHFEWIALQPASTDVNGSAEHKAIRNGNQVQVVQLFRKRLKHTSAAGYAHETVG